MGTRNVYIQLFVDVNKIKCILIQFAQRDI